MEESFLQPASSYERNMTLQHDNRPLKEDITWDKS